MLGSGLPLDCSEAVLRSDTPAGGDRPSSGWEVMDWTPGGSVEVSPKGDGPGGPGSAVSVGPGGPSRGGG